MLRNLADRLARSPLQRHLFFIGLTLFTIVFFGYHVGTFDQVVHLPFLKKFADPSLYPNDQFMDLRFQHYSYFWFLFQPFYLIGALEIAMFAAHLFATYAAFWALWNLSDMLFHNPLGNVISLLAFTIPRIGYGGWPIFEFSLLNRTFVFPFLLFAIILFLRRRYIAAFAVLGAMYNLHVISVNFVLAMFLFDALLEWKKIGIRNIAIGLVVFAIESLPVVLWKIQGPPTDFSIRPDWLTLIAMSSHFNLFYLIAPNLLILLATASGTGILALYFIARYYAPPVEHGRTVLYFVYALLLVLIAQIITSQWLPIVIVIESQIIRAGIFISVFAYLYFGNYLAQRYQAEGPSLDLHLLTLTTFGSIVGFLPPLLWATQRWITARPIIKWAATSILAAAPVAVLGFTIFVHLWYPGIYIYPHQTAWYDAQIWARDHTPKNAVFIAQPAEWWVYESDWRVYSERSTVVSYSDLLEASVVLDYIDTWKMRFEKVAPGAIPQFRGNVIDNLAITTRAFNSLSDPDLLHIGEQFGAQYLVDERNHPHDFSVLYANERFVIYHLP